VYILALSYSHYYNNIYDRRGYLFQDRFASKPIDSDAYLLVMVRYIHRNLLEVGRSMDYWISYSEYVSKASLTDTAFVLSLFAQDTKAARLAFESFVEAAPDDSFSYLDEKSPASVSDNKAIGIILSVSRLASSTDFAHVEKDELMRVVGVLMDRHLSIRQISRLTGISRGTVACASVKR
jgi:hypothetical protein